MTTDRRPGDRHKGTPKAVRMPGALLAWYKRHAVETGLPVNAAIVAALEDYRQRHDGSSTTVSPGSVGVGITVDPRQPPGIVSVVSRGKETAEVCSFALGAETGAEPGRNPCPSVRPGPPPADGEYRCELGKGHAGQHCFAGSRWSDQETAPERENKTRAKGPCEHRVSPGSYCRRCDRLI